MVVGGDSRTEGCGFESRHCILDIFSHIFVVKICNGCLKKRSKLNEKEAEVGPFKKNHKNVETLKKKHLQHLSQLSFLLNATNAQNQTTSGMGEDMVKFNFL